MPCLDYEKLSALYKPEKVRILLIGEAPPPCGTKYFYSIPNLYRPSKNVEDDYSLPATIFNHFFGRRPENSEEYGRFLNALRDDGIFLIDIINEPLRIRDQKIKGGINTENLLKLFSDDNLTLLRNRILQVCNEDTQITFLLARNYRKWLREKLYERFDAEFICWKKYRLDVSDDLISI